MNKFNNNSFGLRFGDFTPQEMAEFDLSRNWRVKRPTVVTVEPTQTIFAWVWEKIATKKGRREMRSIQPERVQPTAREKLRYGLKKKFAGSPAGFYYAFSRFLGDSRMKVVSPFYKEIYEELKTEALKNVRRVKKEAAKIEFGSCRFEPLENFEGMDCPPFDDGDIPTSPQRPRRVVRDDLSNVLIGPALPHWLRSEPVRDENLLRKLRFVIRMMAITRKEKLLRTEAWEKEYFSFRCYMNRHAAPIAGEPEMEGQQGEELVHLKSGNVVLSESNPSSNTVTAVPAKELSWSVKCSSEIATDYSYLTNRWTLIHYATWNNTALRGTEIALFKLNLPLDIRVLGTAGHTPLRAPFDIFTYYKTDIEIKIHVNSNKFQMGQLQFSFQYMDHLRPTDSFSNMYTRSQLPHVIINAGASNEATLYIPYKNMMPYMSTQYGAIGTLRCFVVSPLNSGDNCPKSCGVTMYARLPNCEFVGMKDGGVTSAASFDCFGEPEMEAAAAAMVAGQVIDKVIGDKNCDQPVDSSPPSYIVPTASHTWSLSSGLASRLHNLRLMNPSAQVGRPSGIDMSETSIGVPCRTFGMLKHITWDATTKDKNKNGYELWRCEAHPQLDKSKFYKIVQNDALDTYAVPPITVVSGMYKQWRGSLEFKFDVVCTQYHTGRLLVAYIPNATKNTNITLDQARNSPCAEFSLQDSSSFTFTVPFISPMPWWLRKYSGPLDVSGVQAPSVVVMFVLNPLVYMDSVPKTIDLIPYVRGGTDFEVSVPVQPANSLGSNNKSTIKDQDKVYPDNKSYPMRVTKSQKFYDSTKYVFYEGSDTLGTTCGFHASSTPMKKDSSGKNIEFYYSKAEKPQNMPACKWKIFDDTKKAWTEQVLFVGFVVLWWSDKDKYYYGVPFPTGALGEQYAKTVAAGLLLGKNTEQLKTYLFDYIEDSGWSSSNLGDLKFIPSIVTQAEARVIWINALRENWEVVGDPEMEERYSTLNLLNPVPSLSSTGCGSFTFNENFSDMKDLARRYQLYLSKDIVLDSGFNNGEGIAVIPIIPSGLPLDVEDPESIWNYIRDGHIPLIANGYVYYRGSIRMRLVVSSDDECFDGSSVWVQHHPDMPLNSKLEPEYFPKLQTDDKLKCHGYGFYLQNLNINRTVELEIPFYQPGMYGLLNNTLATATAATRHFTHLGNLVIGLCSPCVTSKRTINLQIYYSIGDDMSFSTFRGFDMVCFTDEVWKPDRVGQSGTPEMEEASECADPEMWASLCSGVVSSLASLGTNVAVKAASTSFAQDIKKDVGKAIGVALAERIQEPIVDLRKEIAESKERVLNQVSEGMKDSIITNLFCQLAHVAASPTLATVAVSFASLLVQILNLSYNQLAIFTQTCSKFFEASWGSFSKSVLPDAPTAGMPEADYDLDECERSLLALLFTSICALFGCSKLTAPKGCGELLRGINSGVCLFNNLVRLLENSGKIIKQFIKYIQSKLTPGAYLEGLLEDDCPEVEQWVKEVQFLLDARNKERFIYDRLMLARVFDAATFGALLVSNGLDERKPGGKVLWDLYKEIRKLRNDLCERGAHPDVRFEPFPIWITGKPGIGKSYLVTQLSNQLLRRVNYTAPGSMIYNVPAANKHWSGVTNPSVLVSDDLFQVSGTKLEEELANIFMICSSSVLNPPMAAVEDKERRLNPLLYIMLCNSSFPDLGTTMRTPEALYRRRKFLIEADYTEAIYNEFPDLLSADDLPRDRVANCAHLRFRTAVNPKLIDTTWSNWMDYPQLLELIGERFQRFYEHERANFRQRMINMYSLDPHFNELNLVNELPVLQDVASLREQMDLVRARINQQIDDLNDPMRVEERDAWYYIRAFRDRVANWGNAPEMERAALLRDYTVARHSTYREPSSPPNRRRAAPVPPVPEPEPPRVFASHEEFRDAVQEHLKAKRTEHHDVLDPYFERYLAHFADLHEKFEKCMIKLPDNIRDRYTTLHALYPNSEIMGIDVFLNLGARLDLENWFCRGFMDKLIRVGGPTTAEFSHMMDQLNLTLFEMLQFLFHTTHRENDLVKMLILGKVPENFCGATDKGVFADDGFNIVEMYQLQPGEVPNQHTPKHKLPVIRQADGFNMQGSEILHNFTVNRKMNVNYFAIVGECLCERFDDMPEVIKGQFVQAQSYKDLYEVCNLVFNMPSMRNNGNELFDNEYVGLVLTTIVLALQTIYDYHSCATSVSYTASLSYCSLRNTLFAADGTRVGVCTHPGCRFSSDLLYFLGCVQASDQHWYFTDALMDQDGYVYSKEYSSRLLSCDALLRRRREKRIDEACSSFKDYIKDFFYHTLPTKAWEIFVYVFEYLPLIISVLWTMWGAYTCYKNLWGSNPEESSAPPTAEPEANYFKFNQPKFPTKPKVPVGPKMFHTPEMSVEQRQAMVNRINKNGVLIYCNWVQDNMRMTRNCRCLMLGGRYMLVLLHYLEEYTSLVEKGYQLNLDLIFGNKVGDPVKTNITFEELTANIGYAENSNFCIVELPKFVRLFPKIYPFFATRSQHNNIAGKVDMITVAGESSFDMPVTIAKDFVVNATSNSSEVVCERVYGYSKRAPGLCGSVIVSNNLGSGNGAIIGMHIAGNAASGTGYAEPLYQEMFSEIFNVMPVRDVMEPTVVPIENARVELDGNMFMYGCVPDRFAHTESGKTNIVPSLLYNQIYPPVTEVNPLKPNDPRQPPGSDPLRDGCNKHGSGNVVNFNAADVEMVKTDLTDRMNQIIVPIRAEVKPLTYEQAICGDVDVPYFESLNWKSSEGFPLSTFRPGSAHDKRWLFDLEEGQFGYKLNKNSNKDFKEGLHIKLQQQMTLRDMCFEKNIKPPTVYIDCLKDYRLKPAKCAKPGSTRIFSVAPIQCSIDIRRHLSDFTASLKATHIQNSIGIGINPDSIEWTQLVNYLFEVGNCIITLDYSNFGPCLMSQLVAASNECIVEWHRLNGASDEHVNRVEWLLDCDILNPVHLCSNVLYQTVNGIASGSPLTGECNSIPNLFYIRCTYLEIMREKCPDYANMYYFNLFVRIVVYGDDLIMSVSPDIIDIFNAITIRDALNLHGIVVTSAQKNAELTPYEDIYHSTFLKRSFARHPTRSGIWLAPVEKDSVQECINWMHRCDDPIAATAEVVQASLDLAYGHGPEYYNEHRANLIKACKLNNIVINSKTWYERDCEIFGEKVPEIKSFKSSLPWYYKLNNITLTQKEDVNFKID
ncbi:polyprotein [Recilia dorsalis iflavirus 1]|nr:polyprotein [Recilia dorsalis iflavirus 1]